MADEKTFTVPLRRGFVKTPRYKRTNKAVKVLKQYLVRHMSVHETDIKLGQHLNEFLWQNGIKNPPGKVEITAQKLKDGVVQAELKGKKFKTTVKPEERKEAPQGLKEKLQAAVGKKDDSPATEEAVEDAKAALEKPEEKPKDKPVEKKA